MQNLLRRFWRALRTGAWVYDHRAALTMRMWAFVALPVLALVSMGYAQDGLTNGAGKVLGMDFIDFWSGARFALAGKGASVYDLEVFRAAIREVAGAEIEPYLYSYPPSLMLMTLPLAMLPFVVALVVWTVGGGVALFALLRPLMGWRDAVFALLAAPATFVNAMYGQTGALSAIFLGGGLLLLASHPVMAGILLGLLSYKPQLGILLPIALACGGHWRAFLSASLSVVVLFVVSAAFVGVDAWLAYPKQMEEMQVVVALQGEGLWHRIPTAYMSARLIGVGPVWAWAVHIPVVLVALAAVFRVWRRHDALPSVKATTLVLATFLATPYAWDYDLVILVVLVAWRFKEGGWRPWEVTALIATVLMPFFLATFAGGLGVPTGPLVFLFALWAVARNADAVDGEAMHIKSQP